jgi:hypothetical protein
VTWYREEFFAVYRVSLAEIMSGVSHTLKDAAWLKYGNGVQQILSLLDGDDSPVILFHNTTGNYALRANVYSTSYSVISIHNPDTFMEAKEIDPNGYHMLTSHDMIISPIVVDGKLNITRTKFNGKTSFNLVTLRDNNDTELYLTKSCFADMRNLTYYWIGRTEQSLVFLKIHNLLNVSTFEISTLPVDIFFTTSCAYAISSERAYVFCGFGGLGPNDLQVCC